MSIPEVSSAFTDKQGQYLHPSLHQAEPPPAPPRPTSSGTSGLRHPLCTRWSSNSNRTDSSVAIPAWRGPSRCSFRQRSFRSSA